ncbi:OmpA family protein [Lunatimonas lonarensis]|uniref:OmpA family protein n=1 Tax=Lunatimonas lonarensis TaxID=1232681 RepID=R7ZPU3_9BACT|nr:OmpA family protein [Lunatimonas lonarensis]EON76092.1 OmpA family protein [Lunatimonas lonarensis]
MKHMKFLLGLFLSGTIISSCADWSNTGKGAAVGAGAGGAIGGLIGNKKGNTAGGAIIGAAVGGAAGAAIGKYMDRQAKELEAIENAQVERVEEGIKIVFESGILFGFDSFALTPDSQKSVMELADILNKYPDTNVVIEGHTDNRGSASYNQGLSERRANSVANYLKTKGVSGDRLTTIGYGFERPVASNDTDQGRAQNRRVEIGITANETLLEKAESGDLE